MSTRRLGRSLGIAGCSVMLAFAVLILFPAVFHAAPQGQGIAAGAGGGYHVIRNITLGGDGSWDYVTVDPENKRVYAPRTTDIQVVDETSGKLVADITGFQGLHGIAIAPEFNRGFVTGNDPDAEIYLVDIKEMKMTGK